MKFISLLKIIRSVKTLWPIKTRRKPNSFYNLQIYNPTLIPRVLDDLSNNKKLKKVSDLALKLNNNDFQLKISNQDLQEIDRFYISKNLYVQPRRIIFIVCGFATGTGLGVQLAGNICCSGTLCLPLTQGAMCQSIVSFWHECWFAVIRECLQ